MILSVPEIYDNQNTFHELRGGVQVPLLMELKA